MVVYALNPSNWVREKQADLHEFETSLLSVEFPGQLVLYSPLPPPKQKQKQKQPPKKNLPGLEPEYLQTSLTVRRISHLENPNQSPCVFHSLNLVFLV